MIEDSVAKEQARRKKKQKTYRDWNLQDQPEECVADSQPHDPQIPIPVATSTPAATDPRVSPLKVLANSIEHSAEFKDSAY